MAGRYIDVNYPEKLNLLYFFLFFFFLFVFFFLGSTPVHAQ